MRGEPAAPPADAPGQAARGPTGRAAELTWQLVRRIGLGTRRPGNWVQLFQFGVVGGTGYAINLLVFAALAQGADLHHFPAAVGAFCVAVTNNFVLNRIWTFRRQGAREHHAGFQAARFFTVSIVGLAVNLAVLAVLVDLVGLTPLPGQAIAVAVAMPVNFIGNKIWTFGERKAGGGPPPRA